MPIDIRTSAIDADVLLAQGVVLALLPLRVGHLSL
jgi:hypothetical protein